MGKASIVYVLGLSMILAYVLLSVTATGTSSMDTYSSYYGRTMAHDIAITGANIGASLLLSNPAYSTSLVNQSFSSGFFSVYFDRPPGDSVILRAYSNIEVSGVTLYDTVLATFRLTPFAKYGWFTDNEVNGYSGSPYYGQSDWKITGDSVFGYAHTNGHFNLAGAPYFNDKVTATNAPVLMSLNGVKAPIYKGGYQWGITVTKPPSNLTSLSTAASADGYYISGNDVALTFLAGGMVNVRVPYNTGSTRNDTLPISSVAPNGVFVIDKGDLHVKGTYEGQITVAAIQDGQTGKGNVWIDGNGVVAEDNPATDPNSTDMMGIVSDYSTYITQDLTRNTSSVVNVEAAVYCQNGELTAQNFWTIPKSGRVELFGGVSQHTAGSLGVFSTSSGLLNGFYYTIRHDNRFNSEAPPDFPVSTKYELVSWWEN